MYLKLGDFMLSVVLNRNEEKEKQLGFPWVFNNEIHTFKGDNIVSGEVVKVITMDGKFVAYGFLNTSSKIMVRILSRNEEDVIDREFFKRKMEYAISHRKNLNFNTSNCMRLIFAEADGLPGLIVDKYANFLSVQFLSLGMDKIKNMLVELLVELTGCTGIYERSDVPVREKEGLPLVKGPLYGKFDPRIEVVENGIKFIVDLAEGQKTGYFLDQKLNRDNVKYYCHGKVVLDCFSNVGGFALHACKYGALHVDACDISKKACDDILVNAKLNGFSQLDVICEDTFNLLRDPKLYNKYDTIILVIWSKNYNSIHSIFI